MIQKIKIEHFRKNCIGCNSCVNIAPQSWTMDSKDGKSRLIGSKEKKGIFTADVFEFDKEANQKAAEACPVNIIKVR